jgi:hypothetical protein
LIVGLVLPHERQEAINDRPTTNALPHNMSPLYNILGF